jgi:WD40 repeat protein
MVRITPVYLILTFLFILPAPVGAEPAMQRQQPQLVVQQGHRGPVRAVAVKGNRIVSASDDGTLKVWESDFWKEIRTMKNPGALTTGVVLNRGGTRAISIGNHPKPRFWDLATGKMSEPPHTPDARQTAIAASPTEDSFAVGDSGGQVEIRDFTGETRYQVIKTSAAVAALAYSPDGQLLSVGGSDGSMAVYSVKSAALLKELRNIPRRVVGLGFDTTSSRLAVADAAGNLSLYDALSGTLLYSKKAHDHLISSLCFSKDGLTLITASWDGNVSAWLAKDGSKKWSVGAHTGGVNDIKVLDADRVVSAGEDSQVKTWRINDGSQTKTLQGMTTAVTSVAFTPATKVLPAYFVIGNASGDVSLMDLNGAQHLTFNAGPGNAQSLAFSSVTCTLLAAGTDRVTAWDLVTGTKTMERPGRAPVHIWPDGTRFSFGSPDSISLATVWAFNPIRGTDRTISSGPLSFTSDGVNVFDGRVLKSIDGGSPILAIGGKNGVILPGTKKVLSYENANISIWNLERTRLKRYKSYAAKPIMSALMQSMSFDYPIALRENLLGWKQESITRLEPAPSGKYFVSASGTGALGIWKTDSGGRWNPNLFTEHKGKINDIAVHATDRYILSAGDDGVAILWDAQSEKWLAKLYTFTNNTWAVVAPDGRFDTNNLEEIKGLHWVMPDDPFTPVPVEAFMREYYEPRLLAKLLAEKSVLPVIAPPATKNRVQPEVTIDKIEPVVGQPSKVNVTVTARQGKRNNIESGLRDLRLFRDGQLVGYVDDTLTLKDGKYTETFPVTLPHFTDKQSQVQFTAYAFNVDQVKSRTSASDFYKELPQGPPKRRAVVVAIGAGSNANPKNDLELPPADARGYSTILSTMLTSTGRFAKEDVITVLLTNNGSWDRVNERWRNVSSNLARFEDVKAVFDVLAGRPVSDTARTALPAIDKILPLTPDDHLIITFSGHGVTDKKSGDFYLVTTGKLNHEGKVEDSLISSATLATWLRDIDAGSMTLVIDACHSAAAIGDDTFKPGPMGSKGLGQLAYDKGIRILAGTQADNVAKEYGSLGHGLLTYVLLEEGLKAGKVKVKHGSVGLKQWLSYGVDQVPKVYASLERNTFQPVGGSKVARQAGTTTSIAEKPPQPALFDFKRGAEDLLLAK